MQKLLDEIRRLHGTNAYLMIDINGTGYINTTQGHRREFNAVWQLEDMLNEPADTKADDQIALELD